MTEYYYVIYLNEDGDGDIRRYTREEMLKNLGDDYWGAHGSTHLKIDEHKHGVQFGQETGIMIIKGEQVYPKPKQVVETWDIA